MGDVMIHSMAFRYWEIMVNQRNRSTMLSQALAAPFSFYSVVFGFLSLASIDDPSSPQPKHWLATEKELKVSAREVFLVWPFPVQRDENSMDTWAFY